MSCLKFKSAKLNLYKYMSDQGILESEKYIDLDSLAANEDIKNFQFYPYTMRVNTKMPYGERRAKEEKIKKVLKDVARDYYNLTLEDTDQFFSIMGERYEQPYYKFNFELLDRVDTRRKVLGLYDNKLMADAIEKTENIKDIDNSLEIDEESVDYYREEDLDFLTEMFPSVKEQEDVKAKEIAVTLANRLSAQTGLAYQVISAEEASQITSDTQNPWNGEPAFYYQDRVYFVSEGFKLNQVLHEYAHPIVRAIYSENLTLFENAYRTLLNTAEGAEIVDTVRSLYPEYDINDVAFKQEVFVRALEKAAVNKVNDLENSSGFKKFLTNLLYGIKQLMKKLFGTGIRVSKLDETTTLDQLADMLVGENFILTTEIVSQNDLVDYLRNTEELYNDLSKVDDDTLNNTVNRYFTSVKNILARTRNNKNYEDFVKTITSETGRSIIQDINANLKTAETLTVDDKVKKFRDELDKREKQIKAFVRSTVQTDILTDRVYDKLVDLSKMKDTKEVISKTFYYDIALRNWSKIINEMINGLVDNGLDPKSKLFTKLTDVQNKIDQSNRLINKIYKKGVGGVLFDIMSDLSDSVNAEFERKIKELEEQGAPKKQILKTKAEFDRLKLTRETVDEYLSGMRGDANPISAYTESFSSSPDPIISSLGVFLDNAYTEVDTIATNNTKNFYSDLQKALKKAGKTDKQITSVMKELIYRDKVLYRGQDGKIENFEKLVLLNPHKGYEAVVDKYQFDIEEAKMQGNIELAREISREFRTFQKEFMHNTYVAEFYEKEKIYDSQLGQIAYERKINLLAEIADIDSRIFEDLTEEEAFEQKKELWKKYQQLASDYDENGFKKIGDELDIARIEKEYRNNSRKFYEWKEMTGLFEFKLNEFKQDLLDQGLQPNTEEYEERLNKWLVDNTRVSIKSDFFEEKKKITDKIKQILDSLDKNTQTKLDVGEYYEEIIDIVKGFKDDNNQIDALELGPQRIKKIKKLQEQIEKTKENLAGVTGLTGAELNRFFTLIRKRKERTITAEELDELNSLSAEKESSGLLPIEQEALKELYGQLSDLQSKEPTEYYLDMINSLLSLQELPDFIRDTINPGGFGDTQITKENLSLFQDPLFLETLFNTNEEFKLWYENNHIVKERYDAVEKKQVKYYEPLYIWTVSKPNDPEYYEKYTYSDINPVTDAIQDKSIYIDGVYRIPNFNFYRKNVKKEFRTKRVVGETVDNRGNWLPRTLKQGAKDDRFVNKEYFNLKKNKPELFNVLDVMTKYMLQFQEDKTRSSRLYLDLPRMRKLGSEVLKGKSLDGRKAISSVFKSIKSQLSTSEDDFEFGLNFKQSMNLVRADMFDEEISSIPVRGLYRISPEEVSLNAPYSIVEYMYSLEHQKKLVELNPTVQALQKVVNDPENAIKDLSKVNAYNFVNFGVKSYVNKKGRNIRAETINTIIEREFEGKTRAGILSERSTAQKVIDGLQRQASFGMFAMNIFPSAIKNFGGAFSNMIIEAGGGKYYNGKDLAKAAPRAFKTAMDMSSNIYKPGDKSLEYQLVEYFDPIKGRIQERLGSEFGRSVGTDIIDSVLMFGEGRRVTNGFWTSPRKWLQNEATLNSFFALMNHTKVPQVVDGETRYISYADAWEKGPDGIIKLKDGISEDWALNGKEFKKVKNRTQEVTNSLEGAYSGMDKTVLDRYAIWRLFSALRRYFTRMFLNRFSPTRYNMRLGNLTEGYYWTFLKSIPQLISRISNGGFFLTEQESYAAKKMLTETAVLGMLSFIIAYVLGYDPDDEDRFKKMRERSGDLLSEDFNLGGWLTNHALTSALGTRQEVITFLNPKEYVNLIYSGATPTLGPIVDRYRDFATDGFYLITNDNRAYYKRDVGPYSWQQEGAAKVSADIAYLFGLSGSQIDPIKSVKGYEYQIRR